MYNIVIGILGILFAIFGTAVGDYKSAIVIGFLSATILVDGIKELRNK